jgi:iron-sulfur cluster repair protein YtfE (RIC family)
VFHLLVEQLDDALGRLHTVAELRIALEPLAVSLIGHARVEEETLFGPYEAATGALGPLRCLRHEHQQMDHGIRALFRIEDATHLKTQIQGLIDLTRRHLAREEEVMFAAAKRALSSGKLEECGAAWAKLRGVVIGQGEPGQPEAS